jgi:hypothetical protein
MPGAKQAWPNVAACWSPARPAIGWAAEQRRIGDAQLPAGRHDRGNTARDVEQRQQLRIPAQRVDVEQQRARCVRRHRSHGAGRRSASRPASCRSCRTPAPRARPAPARPARDPAATAAWCRRNRHPAPGRSSAGSGAPGPRRAAHRSAAVRRSCQTMAGATGSPVARSHSTVVSRWLVIAMAVHCAACTPVRRSTSSATPAGCRQISPASCSTQPGWGNLAELLLRDTGHPAGAVEKDGARAGRALVERKDVVLHRPRRLPQAARVRRQSAARTSSPTGTPCTVTSHSSAAATWPAPSFKACSAGLPRERISVVEPFAEARDRLLASASASQAEAGGWRIPACGRAGGVGRQAADLPGGGLAGAQGFTPARCT